MNQETLTRLLSRVASGDVSVDDAKDKFKHLAFEDIGFAHIDHHRSLRKGFPEVIFGEGKTTAQIHGILDKMADREPVILVTRIDPEKAAPILEDFPQAAYFADARLLRIQNKTPEETGRGTILIVSAGTSDIPVASEAELTAAAMGNQVQTLFDVEWQGFTGFSPIGRHWLPPVSSLWWREWKGLCLRWWPAWSRPLLSPCPPVSVTAQASTA